MAFYADICGYIAKKDETGIPADILEKASKSTPLFKPVFSSASVSANLFYISFACKVKLDEDEDELWLSPFEIILKKLDFVHAAVNFEHEESPHVMLYSYFKDGHLKKICSKLVTEFSRESIVFFD